MNNAILVSNIKKIKDVCQKNNRFFKIESSSYTILVITETLKYIQTFDNKMMSYKTLGLINSFKAEIRKNKDQINKTVLKQYRLKYQGLNEKYRWEQILEFPFIHSIDLNRAYERTFYIFGLISKKMYDKLLSVEKLTAKKICGSLATTKTVYEYNGNELLQSYTKYDKDLCEVYFSVCKWVDIVMVESAKAIKDSFIFYHVDCVYLYDYKKIDELVKEINSYDYDCKQKDYKNLILTNNRVNTKIDMVESETENPCKYIIKNNYIEV